MYFLYPPCNSVYHMWFKPSYFLLLSLFRYLNAGDQTPICLNCIFFIKLTSIQCLIAVVFQPRHNLTSPKKVFWIQQQQKLWFPLYDYEPCLHLLFLFSLVKDLMLIFFLVLCAVLPRNLGGKIDPQVIKNRPDSAGCIAPKWVKEQGYKLMILILQIPMFLDGYWAKVYFSSFPFIPVRGHCLTSHSIIAYQPRAIKLYAILQEYYVQYGKVFKCIFMFEDLFI